MEFWISHGILQILSLHFTKREDMENSWEFLFKSVETLRHGMSLYSIAMLALVPHISSSYYR